MSDYPDIERDVPAWKDEPRYGPILNDIFLTGLAQFVRAVVREMADEEGPFIKVIHLSGPDGPKSKNKPSPDLAERLARGAAIQVVNGLDIMPTDDSIRAILLPLFREAVNGKPAEGRGGEG